MKLYISCIAAFFFALPLGISQYWQQRTDYTMRIDMDVKTHRYQGEQSIEYTNNSPNALHKLYYHLYFNAFQPGSMMDLRNVYIDDPSAKIGSKISALKEDEIGYIKVDEFRHNGKVLDTKAIGTILEIQLADPIQPGSTHTLDMDYETQVPVQIRRSGRDNAEGIDYTMTQWYPKLCAYDEDGWHPNQYVGREFYGNWGDFEVDILIDKDYVVAAGGSLQNPKKVGYGYGGEAMEGNDKAAKNGKLLWRFKTENVHDFAWAADPDYTHRVHNLPTGTEIHYFYQTDTLTENWGKLPAAIEEAFAFINKTFGEYPYPSYAFIQGGDGGMEYPFCTMITGHRTFSSLVGVSLHELMHSWYQMMLATDEAQYAWMDEGFTSYSSEMASYYLRQKGFLPGSGPTMFGFTELNDRVAQYASFPKMEAMSVLSDYYIKNFGYAISSYVKGAAYLHCLRGIVGEETFVDIMLRYFDEWKFKHPTPKDFIRIAEVESNINLDWFHNLFVHTNRVADYAITFDFTKDNKSYLRIENNGEFPMPFDLRVVDVEGNEYNYHVPLLSMYGSKSTEGVEVLEPWPWTDPIYSLELPFQHTELDSAVLDPHHFILDVDRSNNVFPPKEEEEEE